MTEGGEGQNGNGGLPNNAAEHWFFTGMANNIQNHLEKAGADLSRGAAEQASEHLKRVGEQLPQLLINSPSTRLSEQENQLYVNLKQQKYRVTQGGMISINMLSPQSENLLRNLEKKAYGTQEIPDEG